MQRWCKLENSIQRKAEPLLLHLTFPSCGGKFSCAFCLQATGLILAHTWASFSVCITRVFCQGGFGLLGTNVMLAVLSPQPLAMQCARVPGFSNDNWAQSSLNLLPLAAHMQFPTELKRKGIRVSLSSLVPVHLFIHTPSLHSIVISWLICGNLFLIFPSAQYTQLLKLPSPSWYPWRSIVLPTVVMGGSHNLIKGGRLLLTYVVSYSLHVFFLLFPVFFHGPTTYQSLKVCISNILKTTLKKMGSIVPLIFI